MEWTSVGRSFNETIAARPIAFKFSTMTSLLGGVAIHIDPHELAVLA